MGVKSLVSNTPFFSDLLRDKDALDGHKGDNDVVRHLAW